MYSWIDLFLYSMYLENCNEILNYMYNFMVILYVYIYMYNKIRY